MLARRTMTCAVPANNLQQIGEVAWYIRAAAGSYRVMLVIETRCGTAPQQRLHHRNPRGRMAARPWIAVLGAVGQRRRRAHARTRMNCLAVCSRPAPLVAPPIPDSSAVDLMSSWWIGLGAWGRVPQSFPYALMGRLRVERR